MVGRQRGWSVAATISACCALAACGTGVAGTENGGAPAIQLDLGGLPESTVPTEGPQALASAPISPLPAGTYRTSVGPEVSFTVDDRWNLETMDATQGALLFGSYSPMNIVAPRVEWIDLTAAGARVVPSRLRGVVGSVDADEFERWAPLPADLASWFASDSGLDVGPIEQVEVGGRPAASFTYAVPDLSPGSAACVVWPCLRLIGGANWGWPALEGDVGRMWIVELDGHQLLLQIRSQPGDADLVIPAGTTVVSSMQIGGGP